MTITPTAGIPANPETLPTDSETGERIERGYFLERLGWPEMPEKLTDEQAAEVVNIISENKARCRVFAEQAERLAKPYAERAQRWQSFFAMHLFEWAKPKLKRAGDKAKKPGEVLSWTVDLPTGKVQIGNVGGIEIEDKYAFVAWLKEQLAIGNPLGLRINVEYSMKADDLEKYLDARAKLTDAAPETYPAGVKVTPKKPVTLRGVE